MWKEHIVVCKMVGCISHLSGQRQGNSEKDLRAGKEGGAERSG